MRMLKKVSDKGVGETKPQAYRYSTHPALSQPRPAPSPRYVEDFGEPRTQLGTFFSILRDYK